MRALLAFFALVGLVALSGCSHYRLGTGTKLGFQTLYIPPVVNDTNLPQTVALVSTQIREAFLTDGRVTLVDSEQEADATLTIRLTSYGRETLTAQAGDTGLARKFGLTLATRATLRDNREGKAIFENRAITAERQIFTDNPSTSGGYNNQLQAEYQAAPLLAETLADNVKHAVLDTW